MSCLFKPVVIEYRDPAGQRCPATEALIVDVGGKKRLRPRYTRARRVSKKWYGQYADRDGQMHRVPLSPDKAASRELLAAIVVKAIQTAQGLADPFEEQKAKPLAVHLEDFRRGLEAKANTAKHVELTYSRARAVVDGCKFDRIGDIEAARVVEWLAAERKAERIGVQTSNYYLASIKAFALWLVSERRTGDNPLAHVKRLNARADVRVERRALGQGDFARLIEATRTSARTFRGLGGHDRAMLYTAAVQTGFRASELASLNPSSFDFRATPPTVKVEAAYSKHRRDDLQPIREDVAELLQAYLQSKASDQPVWPGTWPVKAAEMVRRDLEAAGIPFDLDGRVFDFHALRHQFISNLAAAGVHPKVAQTLARHSTITLTMDRYSHLTMVDQTAALNMLPGLPGAGPEAMKATGTDGSGYTGVALTQAVSGRIVTCPDGEGGESADPAPRSNPMKKAEIDASSRPVTCPDEVKAPGLEPGTYGLKVRLLDNQAQTHLQDVLPFATAGQADAKPGCTGVAQTDPILARIIEAWPRLTTEQKSRVLEVVEGTKVI